MNQIQYREGVHQNQNQLLVSSMLKPKGRVFSSLGPKTISCCTNELSILRLHGSTHGDPETINTCRNEFLGRASDKALYDIPPRAAKLTEKTHLFMVRTFSEPTQCAICCSYMLGLWRQGVICQECELPCHIHCAKSADQTCPLPLEFKNKKTEGLDTVNYANEMVV